MILGYCRFCHSSNTKVSYAYPEDYYCQDCKQGDTLDTLLSKAQLDRLNSNKAVKQKPHYLKVDSNNPCMEEFLEEESQIAVWPQDNGICDYGDELIICDGIADAMILHNKGFKVVGK